MYSGWQGDTGTEGEVGAGKYLNQLFSLKLSPAISIDRMAFVCFPPISFAAVIHLHASNCIRYKAWVVFNELERRMHLGSS